jgi:hypothetical protein
VHNHQINPATEVNKWGPEILGAGDLQDGLWESLDYNGREGGYSMARVSPYYSVNEAKKPTNKQVHHTDDQCRAGRDIPQNERRPGTGGYRHCEDCES